ncbi:hypothetical protein CYMTET_49886, partial [Cymbomonas tetramitiformis]
MCAQNRRKCLQEFVGLLFRWLKQLRTEWTLLLKKHTYIYIFSTAFLVHRLLFLSHQSVQMNVAAKEFIPGSAPLLAPVCTAEQKFFQGVTAEPGGVPSPPSSAPNVPDLLSALQPASQRDLLLAAERADVEQHTSLALSENPSSAQARHAEAWEARARMLRCLARRVALQAPGDQAPGSPKTIGAEDASGTPDTPPPPPPEDREALTRALEGDLAKALEEDLRCWLAFHQSHVDQYTALLPSSGVTTKAKPGRAAVLPPKSQNTGEPWGNGTASRRPQNGASPAEDSECPTAVPKPARLANKAQTATSATAVATASAAATAGLPANSALADSPSGSSEWPSLGSAPKAAPVAAPAWGPGKPPASSAINYASAAKMAAALSAPVQRAPAESEKTTFTCLESLSMVEKNVSVRSHGEAVNASVRSGTVPGLQRKQSGAQVNILQGLELHRRFLSAAEQEPMVSFLWGMKSRGEQMQLRGATFSAPSKWMKGKGRVTLQFGCCYNYREDSKGRPPGILVDEHVEPMPPELTELALRAHQKGVLPMVADSAIVNFYET